MIEAMPYNPKSRDNLKPPPPLPEGVATATHRATGKPDALRWWAGKTARERGATIEALHRAALKAQKGKE